MPKQNVTRKLLGMVLLIEESPVTS